MILRELEGRPELEAELGLFNRLGDLYLKSNKVQAAVETYERAADFYERAGFPNNAIALCNKILRNAPGRTNVYLKLARLMLQRGFSADAKTNLLEYASRMQKAGQLEQAFKALKDFADLSPENEEIRLLLAEQLRAAARTDEAREQMAKLYADVEAQGDERKTRSTLDRLKEIDPGFSPSDAPKPRVATTTKQKGSELVFIDLDDDASSPGESESEAPAATVEPEPEPEAAEGPQDELGVEPTSLAEEDEPEVEDGPQEPADDLVIERTSADLLGEPDDIAPVAGLEAAGAEGTEGAEGAERAEGAEGAEEDAGIEIPDLDLSELDDEHEGVIEAPARELSEELPAEAPAPPTLDELEAAVAADPDDPAAHQSLGEALIEAGERERGLEELDHALTTAEARGEWSLAEAMADEIIRLDPSSVRHHQKRVEYAYRRNDKNRLVRAYLTLADSLFRQGHTERARAVYQRVIEHDPDNEDAVSALETLAPDEPGTVEDEAEEPVAQPVASRADTGDFVDLGSLLLETDRPRIKNTRMRIEEEEPTGDEERDFAEMLSTFKKGIQENVDEEDWQAHYDLGIAFKEMGLLDEAIGEFQKALKRPEGRLRSAEALGNCFFEKGQYSVAATVLRRAVDADVGGDDEKVGLLYLVGRAEEEQGRVQQALEYYQRVFAIDIDFQDVSDRVKSLASALS